MLESKPNCWLGMGMGRVRTRGDGGAVLMSSEMGEGSYYSSTTANEATDTHTCAPFSFSHVYTAKSPLRL